jgi:hypothetical protein
MDIDERSLKFLKGLVGGASNKNPITTVPPGLSGTEAKEILALDYAGGPDAFRREAAIELGLTLEEMPPGAPNTRRIRDILNAKKLGWNSETNVTPSQYLSRFDIETDAQRAKADLFSAKKIHDELRTINEKHGIASRRKIDEKANKFLITSEELVSIAKAVLGQGDPSASLSDKGHFISQGPPAGIPAGDMLRTHLDNLLRDANVTDPLRHGLTVGDDSMVTKAVNDYHSGALSFNAAVRQLTDLGAKPGDIPRLLRRDRGLSTTERAMLEEISRRRDVPDLFDTLTTQTTDQQIQSILTSYLSGQIPKEQARQELVALGITEPTLTNYLSLDDRPSTSNVQPEDRPRGGGQDNILNPLPGEPTGDGNGGEPLPSPLGPKQAPDTPKDRIAAIKAGMLANPAHHNYMSVEEGIESFIEEGLDRDAVLQQFPMNASIRNIISSSSAWDATADDGDTWGGFTRPVDIAYFGTTGIDAPPPGAGDFLPDPTDKDKFDLADIYQETGARAAVTDYLSRIFPGMMGGPFGNIIDQYRDPLRQGYNLSNLLGTVGGTGDEGSTFENYLDALQGRVPRTSYGQVAQLASDLTNWEDIGTGQQPAWQDVMRRKELEDLRKNPQAQFNWWLRQQEQQLPWHMRGRLRDSATRRFDQLLAQRGRDPDWQFLPYVMREGLYPGTNGGQNGASLAEYFRYPSTGSGSTGSVPTELESTLTPAGLGNIKWPGTYYDEPWESKYKR